MNFTETFIAEAVEILNKLDIVAIEKIADILAQTRDRGGRLFVLGVGGSAANASHAVNDFRKIVGIETYALPIMFPNSRRAQTMKGGHPLSKAGWKEVI